MNSVQQEAKFREWLEIHRPVLFKVVHSFAQSREDKADLFQEMLVQLWRSVRLFKGQSSPSTWIYRVALNTAMGWKRKDGRRIADSSSAVCSEDIAATDERDSRRIHALYAAIRTLPKSDAALVLMQLDGLSYREISAVLGISEVNVGARLTRARCRLREIMKEEHE
jgi:RNA polymerase sigma-70 factor (ECF subfamily)